MLHQSHVLSNCLTKLAGKETKKPCSDNKKANCSVNYLSDNKSYSTSTEFAF